MATSDKPRRRWFSYSLRTVFVLLTVFCVWLGIQVDRAKKQEGAVKWIRGIGGDVRYDDERNEEAAGLGEEYATPRNTKGPRWMKQLVGRDYFATVIRIELPPTSQVTEADLDHLANLTDLEEFVAKDCKLGDGALARLGRLKKLKVIVAPGNEITDAGLAHLKGSTALEVVRLGNNRITDAGFAHLAGLTRVRDLDLRHNEITDSGLKHLKSLSALRMLSLSGNPITDAGLTELQSLDRMRVLGLRDTLVSVPGLKRLRGSAVSTLSVGNNKISSVEEAEITRMLPQVQHLNGKRVLAKSIVNGP